MEEPKNCNQTKKNCKPDGESIQEKERGKLESTVGGIAPIEEFL